MPRRAPTFAPPKVRAPVYRPKEADRQATRALHTGSKAWRRLREQVLVRDGYRCQGCGVLAGPSAHVDHIGNDAADPASNRLDNLRCLCLRCHSSATRTAQNGAEWTGRRTWSDPSR